MQHDHPAMPRPDELTPNEFMPDELMPDDFMAPSTPPVKRGRYDRVRSRLADAVLAHLPQAVAVLDRELRLLMWNAQASVLWGMPPLMAAERPALADAVAAIDGLTEAQRGRLMEYCTENIQRGDRVEPDSWLRLASGRDRRLTIQVIGMGRGTWMLTLGDGHTLSGSDPSRQGEGWLDALTGLRNRRQFELLLRDVLEQDASGSGHALMLLDIDHLQAINDAHGRGVGDALLCLVARRLERALREGDVLARVGGDEFAILVPNGTTSSGLAVRLLADLSLPFQVEGTTVGVSTAIGIAHLGSDTAADATASGTARLLGEAVAALADAKAKASTRWAERPDLKSRGLETSRRKTRAGA